MPRKRNDRTPYDIYTCVRHNAPRKDTSLSAFYLCDRCAGDIADGAFNGASPVFEGARLDGYCALCNRQLGDIRLRQWFLCGVCERVARSIGRGRVAAQHVLDWWNHNILPVASHLTLAQTDPVALRAVSVDRSMDKVTRPDFTGIDRRTGEAVLVIELKTGRSPISGMSQFQLDTTDCDDILAVVREKLIPGYVLHAQVVEQFAPPTSYFKAVALWWTDIFAMTNAFVTVRRRQVEQRYAAFFNRRCFRPIESFIEQIRDQRYMELRDRILREGVPPLYSPA